LVTRDHEETVRTERVRKIGLFRYELIRHAADPAHSRKERGLLVKRLAQAEHTDPFGSPVRISRQTLDRWIKRWREGGFDALLPNPRHCCPRTPMEVLDLAAGLRRENPDRTVASVRRILRTQLGWAPDETTLCRHFHRLGLMVQAPTQRTVFGRFEADRPNELWVGDALHGPRIAGRKTYLFAFLDDHSRLVVGHRFGYCEDTVRLAAALRPALASRGVPTGVYVDNGSAFVDTWLLRACAKLGIRLIHSTPHRPQGRGKIERFFRSVRDQFLVEVASEPTPGRHEVTSLDELNRLFTAWVETCYHHTVHSETGQYPLQRWDTGEPIRVPTPQALSEAFLWEEHRRVQKTATVSLHGNTYQVDPSLIGRRVQLVFDPFDLSRIEVRDHDRNHGLAIPQVIGRHSHPRARPETPIIQPAPTGIDYLNLIDRAHQEQINRHINYHAMTEPAGTPTTDIQQQTGKPS